MVKELEQAIVMAENGDYKPLSLSDAVERSAAVLNLLRARDVHVIRIGLCASENLSSESTYFAGPNHSALGELVENEFYYGCIKEEINNIQDLGFVEELTVSVSRGSLSKAIGQRRSNIIRLSQDYPRIKIHVIEDEMIPADSLKVIIEKVKTGCI